MIFRFIRIRYINFHFCSIRFRYIKFQIRYIRFVLSVSVISKSVISKGPSPNSPRRRQWLPATGVSRRASASERTTQPRGSPPRSVGRSVCAQIRGGECGHARARGSGGGFATRAGAGGEAGSQTTWKTRNSVDFAARRLNRPSVRPSVRPSRPTPSFHQSHRQ